MLIIKLTGLILVTTFVFSRQESIILKMIGRAKEMLLIMLLVKNVFASGNKTIDCTKYDYKYFAIPDILSMLICYNHTKHIVNCPPKQLYVPGYPHCTSAEKYKNNQNDLCLARKKKLGNIQNPWNCHSFLTCVHGISTGERPCQDKSLVYNPYKDQCQYSYQYKCQQA